MVLYFHSTLVKFWFIPETRSSLCVSSRNLLQCMGTSQTTCRAVLLKVQWSFKNDLFSLVSQVQLESKQANSSQICSYLGTELSL